MGKKYIYITTTLIIITISLYSPKRGRGEGQKGREKGGGRKIHLFQFVSERGGPGVRGGEGDGINHLSNLGYEKYTKDGGGGGVCVSRPLSFLLGGEEGKSKRVEE